MFLENMIGHNVVVLKYGRTEKLAKQKSDTKKLFIQFNRWIYIPRSS